MSAGTFTAGPTSWLASAQRNPLCGVSAATPAATLLIAVTAPRRSSSAYAVPAVKSSAVVHLAMVLVIIMSVTS